MEQGAPVYTADMLESTLTSSNKAQASCVPSVIDINIALFDLDGTLVDTAIDITRAVNQARSFLGLQALDEGDVAPCIGQGLEATVRKLVPFPPELEAAVQARCCEFYEAHCCDHARLYPGVSEMLCELFEHGVPMAIVTNKKADASSRIVRATGLSSFMVGIQAGDRYQKPAPTPILVALETLFRVTAPARLFDSVWMVGDHENDLLAASAAGVASVWCAWGYGRPLATRPTIVAHAPAEVASAILDSRISLETFTRR